jgi:hypothetical protein
MQPTVPPRQDERVLELPLFEEVAEVLRGLVPRDLGALRARARRYGIKVWLDGAPDRAPREHYEAQVIGKREVPGAKVLALEIGFHAEHPDSAMNDVVLSELAGAEKAWRRELGAEAVAGPFLGRADVWRRVSETWPDPDLSDPDLAFEIGSRLTDYITALEPVRRR